MGKDVKKKGRRQEKKEKSINESVSRDFWRHITESEYSFRSGKS